MIDLMRGDCLELMKQIPDGSVDAIITDPPYGMSLKPQRKSGKFHGKTINNDNNLDWVDSFFCESFRLLPKNSAAIIFCSHQCIAEFIFGARKAGFDIKNLIVWDKKQFGMGGNWRPKHELILICVKGRFVTHSNSLSTIIEFKRTHHTKAQHPTQKPVDLMQHLIEQPDYNPQVILDPFMGVGSTGVAAKNLGRSFIGIELDEGYFKIASERIRDANAK